MEERLRARSRERLFHSLDHEGPGVGELGGEAASRSVSGGSVHVVLVFLHALRTVATVPATTSRTSNGFLIDADECSANPTDGPAICCELQGRGA